MNFLEKIQNLPESKRKIILWLAVIIISFILLFFWFRNFQEKLKNFPEEKLNQTLQIPPSQELPKFDLPKVDEETLKQIEEMIKNATQTQGPIATSTEIK